MTNEIASGSSSSLLLDPLVSPVHGDGSSTVYSLTGDMLQARIERWMQRLSALTELQLPTDYPRPLPLQVVEAEKTLALPDALCLGLLQLSLQLSSITAEDSTSQVTPFTILLSAFALLIHRYTGEEDIAVGSSSLSSNPLVLRLAVRGSDSFASLVLHVKQVGNAPMYRRSHVVLTHTSHTHICIHTHTFGLATSSRWRRRPLAMKYRSMRYSKRWWTHRTRTCRRWLVYDSSTWST